MEAKLEHVFQRDGWNVYITDRGGVGGGRRVMKPGGCFSFGGVLGPTDPWIDVGEGTVMPEPTFFLSSEVLAAIVAAGNAEQGVKPPNTSQADHLADAVGVRDRLLTLIEKGWT